MGLWGFWLGKLNIDDITVKKYQRIIHLEMIGNSRFKCLKNQS